MNASPPPFRWEIFSLLGTGREKQEAPMLLKAQDENSQIIEKVVTHLRSSEAKRANQAETFIRQYYKQVDCEDLSERSISNLCGAALAHLDFMREFKSGAPKLRV